MKIDVQKISDSNQGTWNAEHLVHENFRYNITILNWILDDVSVSDDGDTSDALLGTTS